MKKIILTVIAIIVALSLVIGLIATIVGADNEGESVAIVGGSDGPTDVYLYGDNVESTNGFLTKLSENEFLSQEVILDLTKFSHEEKDDGTTFFYWRSYGDSTEDVTHKIEMIEKVGMLNRYHYKSYRFDVPKLNKPMSMDVAQDMVEKFAKIFISDKDEISFKNEPTNHTLYDPGHVELWYGDYKSNEYVIAVDLDMGNVIYFEIL